MGQYLDIILKLIVSLSILNVWLLRANKASTYRGGKAQNIKQEFEAYGLSENTMKAVGFVKCLLAVLLLVSIVYQPIEMIAVAGICIMMAGAIFMHFKINDPAMKAMPAALFLVLTALTIVL